MQSCLIAKGPIWAKLIKVECKYISCVEQGYLDFLKPPHQSRHNARDISLRPENCRHHIGHPLAVDPKPYCRGWLRNSQINELNIFPMIVKMI